jgi:hypothetical protein
LDHVSRIALKWSEMRHAFIVDIAESSRAVRDLSAGGVFVADAHVELQDVCNVILRAGAAELCVEARVVLVTEEGAGLQIDGFTSDMRERIASLVEIARLLDLERRKTLTGSLASFAGRRPHGSIPPATRPAGSHRLASGSIAPPSRDEDPPSTPDSEPPKPDDHD